MQLKKLIYFFLPKREIIPEKNKEQESGPIVKLEHIVVIVDALLLEQFEDG